jgi:two-component system sensor histidine kinase ChvG
MAVRAESGDLVQGQQQRRARPRWRALRRAWLRTWRFIGIHAFSSITRRIIILNLAALVVLVSGILVLNQFRAGLIDARVQSLTTQGEIIAGAIAASATVETNTITIDPDKLLELRAGESLSPFDQPIEGLDFPINPERVAPVLRRLISPTRTRARIYDRDGILVVDSRHLYSRGQVLTFDLPPPETGSRSVIDSVLGWVKLRLRGDMPIYQEVGAGNGKAYPEVVSALSGQSLSVVRLNDQGELIVSVAVPIQRFRAVLGTLLLSTQGGDIDAIVQNERVAIVRVFLVAATVTLLLSFLMAGTIAAPLRRLADAADRVRRGGGVRSRPQIPDFTHRRDEVGHLSQALREMTRALYNRIEAIENFAADVSHELKNPLTSLRSAVETLPLAKTPEAKERLTSIIYHDVRRLDRLITDISDASRLDAELARQDAVPIDLSKIVQGVAGIAREMTGTDGPRIQVDVAYSVDRHAYIVIGHESRIGQVFNNLIDNARSFCRKDGTVRVAIRRVGSMVEATVDDDGPGIRPDSIDRIFERFYTDRPDGEAFGQNSGLGLSITKQIVEAHRGRIWAENRVRPRKAGETGEPEIIGARFIIRIPAVAAP